MNRWALYEREKAAWLRAHPRATAAEIERAMRRLAQLLRV